MSHCAIMRSSMVVVCLVIYFIELCRGQMFGMDLIEPPENPEPGMTYEKGQYTRMSDYKSNGRGNRNGDKTFNRDDELELSDLDTTLTKLEKWKDFEEIAEEIEKKNKGKVNVNWEQDVRDLSKWLKDLKEGHVKKEAIRTEILSHPFQNKEISWKRGQSSPGMSMYWPAESVQQNEPVFPNQETDVKKSGVKIPASDVMTMAKEKMREAQHFYGPPPQNYQFDKEPTGNMDAKAIDDGIGPHAQRLKRSYQDEDYEDDPMAAMPFLQQESFPPMDDMLQPTQRGYPSRGPKSALRLGDEPRMGSAGAMPPQRGAFPQMVGRAPMPYPQQSGYPPRGGRGGISALRQGGMPRMGGAGPMPPQRGAFPQMGGGAPMPYPQQGGYSPEGSKDPTPSPFPVLPNLDLLPDERLDPRPGRLPPIRYLEHGEDEDAVELANSRGPNMGPMSQMGGNSPMPYPQGGAMSQMGGNSPMPYPQGSAMSQMGGNGPMPYPQGSAMSQMGGNGPMPYPQGSAMSQMGENGPIPARLPSSAPQMAGHGPWKYPIPETPSQMGGRSPLKFPPPWTAAQMGGNAPVPVPIPQHGAIPQMGSNGEMPSPQQGPNKDGILDELPVVIHATKLDLAKIADWSERFGLKLNPAKTQIDYYDAPPGMREIGATPEPFRMLPKRDDFNTPIKWVPMSSAKVEDGIAKVTDMDTGRNFNIVINGSIFVPIIDDSILPTIEPVTTVVPFVPRTTTENTAMKALLRFVTPDELQRNDWLGFDAALNTGKADQECDGGGCRARCHTQSCQSRCHGDTCSAGCIGVDCITSCDGPGCLSMCIGDKCKAACNGQACDARCKGTDCTTECKSFSCTHVTNGAVKSGGGTWDQHYPDQGADQYQDGPQDIKPPTDQLRMGPMYEEDYNINSMKSD